MKAKVANPPNPGAPEKRSLPKLKHPNMTPIKWSITYEPPQIGLLYKRNPEDAKKQLFVIQ
jgi:hypothetical protein